MDLLHQSGERLVLDRQPLSGSSVKHVAKADLLGRNLQLRAAVRPLALHDQPGLVQQQKRPPHHDGALFQALRNRRRGVHRIRLTRQHRQNPQTQSKTRILCHNKKATTTAIAALPASPLLANLTV